jgi:hypothetical protein
MSRLFRKTQSLDGIWATDFFLSENAALKSLASRQICIRPEKNVAQ